MCRDRWETLKQARQCLLELPLKYHPCCFRVLTSTRLSGRGTVSGGSSLTGAGRLPKSNERRAKGSLRLIGNQPSSAKA